MVDVKLCGVSTVELLSLFFSFFLGIVGIRPLTLALLLLDFEATWCSNRALCFLFFLPLWLWSVLNKI